MFIETLKSALTVKNIPFEYSCKPCYGPTFSIFPGIKVSVDHKETDVYISCYSCFEDSFTNADSLTHEDVNNTIREVCRLMKLYI